MKHKQDDNTYCVHVPFSFRRRGNTSLIVLNNETVSPFAPREVNKSMLQALSTAFRWKQMIESGQAANLYEIAKREKVNDSYASRVFRLTMLAPDIIESILNGTQPKTLQVRELLQPLPVYWPEQRQVLGF